MPISPGQPQLPGDQPREVFSAKRFLLYPQKEVVATARWRVGGNLLDFKIFGPLLDRAADAGQFGGQERRRLD